MHGEFSGHSGDGLVFVTGIMNEPAERIVSIGVFSYPQPDALDEGTAKLRSARFKDRAVPQHLA